MLHSSTETTEIIRKRPVHVGAERGAVIVWAMGVIFMIGAVVLSGTDKMRALNSVLDSSYEHRALASQVSQAGITDSYAWFRRQNVQPVADFQPVRDLAATTPVNETDDPIIGLVRTFEITPGLWARYEIRKGVAEEPYTDVNGNGIHDASESYTDTNGDGHWNAATGTRDVSAERGLTGTGTVWYLESVGTVYKRSRADLPLGVGPNARVSHSKHGTEIRRLTISPPAEAAICCTRGDDVVIANRARVRSQSGTAVAYQDSTGTPNSGAGELLGSRTSVPGYVASVEAMFGVGWAELRSMADTSTDKPATGLTGDLPDYSMTVVTGDVVFDGKRPLRGTGLLIVKGDLTIEPGSNSFFNGVLYVEGNLTVRAPAYLSGTIVVDGKVDARGTGGDYVEIQHDPQSIDLLLRTMGQYRFTKAVHSVRPRLDDGRPTERRPGHGGSIPAAVPATGTSTPQASTPGNGFAVDGLMGSLQDYLSSNPDADARAKIEAAISRLQLAQARMATDPRDEKGAIQATRQALTQLIVAIRDQSAFSADVFHAELDGGTTGLMPKLQNMVAEMMGSADAPDAIASTARARFNDAVVRLTRARQRMEAGNESGALQDYRAAVNRFGQAVSKIDDYASTASTP